MDRTDILQSVSLRTKQLVFAWSFLKQELEK